MNVYTVFMKRVKKSFIIFSCEVVSIMYVIFMCHLKSFLNEQSYAQEHMSLKTPEKATSADCMGQRSSHHERNETNE